MARKNNAKKGFLARLSKNEAGNTLALTAAATLPLLGLIGGGVDMSRLYLVKTRMQQACDAGALAGRKAQGGGLWSTATQNTANQVFSANFGTDAYGTSGLTRNFVENTGTVTGTASVTVPMMIMKIFGSRQRVVSITCDAEMRLPNTDVMFVLDVTGSMGDPPSSGGYTSKLSGLKTAVQCFYEVVMKIDTPANCGSTPSGGISNEIQVRFGFVPYNVNVNVGKLLPNDYLADSWAYQTRLAVMYRPGPPTTGSYSENRYFSRSSDCRNWATGSDATGFPSSSSTPNSFTVSTTTYTQEGYDRRSDICTRRVDQETLTYTRDDANGSYFHTWRYLQSSWDVSGLKAGGSSWNNSITLPIDDEGDYETVGWDGCVEERQTVRTTNFNPIPSAAYDLDIDMVPTSDTATKWGPLLEEAVWGRYSSGNTLSTVTTSSNLSRNNSYYCPTAARKLAKYETTTKKNDFVTYVNSLTDNGNTYHDIGLLWGARLMSPTGIFGSENAFTPLGGEIQRHLIFMTDGDACTGNENYTAYGIPWWDRRRTSTSSAPSGGCTSTGTITEQVNLRTEALCTAIKNKNITLWVINYGGGVSTSTGARLQACASPGRYYAATSTTDLLTTFQSIAAQISQLRLTN